MGLLTLKNHKLELNPDVLGNPVFKRLWDKDKSKGKEVAYKELLLIFYICDFNSPYAKYPKHEREAKVCSDIYDAKYKISKEIRAVIDEYEEIQYKSSPSMRLLSSSREAVHKLAKWLDGVDYNDNEKAVKEVTDAISKIGKMIESLNQLEEAVKQEITTSARAKGGGTTGLFEE
jgi:hypothetical protein